MRIRKNLRISSLAVVGESSNSVAGSSSSSSPLTRSIVQNQVCELSRSPWDVMVFPSQSADFCLPHQVKMCNNIKIENSVTDNTSKGASISQSIASAEKVVKKEKVEEDDNDKDERKFPSFSEDDNVKRKKVKKKFRYCIKSDGKTWHCKNEAKEANSLCEHHLNKLKTYTYSSTRKSDAPKPGKVVPPPKRTKAVVASASPEDFYYYSGFGPLWGRKRAVGGREFVKEEVVDVRTNLSTHASQNYSDHDDDDDDDNRFNDNGGKKRTRKPIKQRSLKSLL